MVKNLTKLVFAIGLFLSCTTTSYATSVQIKDDANLLDDIQEVQIIEKIESVEKETGFDIMALTTNDTQGMDTAYFSETFFNKNTTSKHGVVVTIDMDNRQIYFATSGDAIYFMTDQLIELGLDDAYGYVSNADYYGTFDSMIDSIHGAYQQGADGNYMYDEDTGEILGVYEEPNTLRVIEIVMSIGAALVAGIVSLVCIKVSHAKSCKEYVYQFRDRAKVDVTVSQSRLVDTRLTSRRLPPPSSSGGGGSSRGGGGGSSVHRGAGGGSFGGGGRSF